MRWKSPSADVFQALGRLGRDAGEAIPMLRKLARNGRFEAAEACAEMDAGPTFVVNVLCGHLLDTNVTVRFQRGLAQTRQVVFRMMSPLFSAHDPRFFFCALWGDIQSACMVIGD